MAGSQRGRWFSHLICPCRSWKCMRGRTTPGLVYTATGIRQSRYADCIHHSDSCMKADQHWQSETQHVHQNCKIISCIHLDIYPVVCLACPPLQAFLQPFSHTSIKKLPHQFASVIQLIRAHNGLQNSQVAFARLLQGWHRQFGQSLLMRQGSLRDLGHRSDQ